MCTIKLYALKCLLYAVNRLVANNELYKTITIDIDKLDRKLTNLQNTSISECTINTTGQPVIEQNVIIRDENISKQINEPENEKLVVDETSKHTEQNKQQEKIPLNKHRAPTNETCIQAIINDYPVTIIDHQNASTGNEI